MMKQSNSLNNSHEGTRTCTCINNQASLKSLSNKIESHLYLFEIESRNVEIYIQKVLSSVERCCNEKLVENALQISPGCNATINNSSISCNSRIGKVSTIEKEKQNSAKHDDDENAQNDVAQRSNDDNHDSTTTSLPTRRLKESSRTRKKKSLRCNTNAKTIKTTAIDVDKRETKTCYFEKNQQEWRKGDKQSENQRCQKISDFAQRLREESTRIQKT